jgi:hypothetical protein
VNNRFKADPSLKSFLFTLKNPHNLPARKFALRAEENGKAIWSDFSWGPCFVDIGVSDAGNANTCSFSCLDGHSVNVGLHPLLAQLSTGDRGQERGARIPCSVKVLHQRSFANASHFPEKA